jgi:NAD(P)-dependent dehydrogenase (short-subunit alcohol dehydrogenase family)
MLQDKVAVITGSSRGIGKAIAKEFLSNGAQVVINGKSGEHLEQVHAELIREGFPDRWIIIQAQVVLVELMSSSSGHDPAVKAPPIEPSTAPPNAPRR